MITALEYRSTLQNTGTQNMEGEKKKNKKKEKKEIQTSEQSERKAREES